MVATHLREGDKVVALDETRRDLLLAKTEDYNAQGFRVLLLATRKLDDAALTTPLSTADEQGIDGRRNVDLPRPAERERGKSDYRAA